MLTPHATLLASYNWFNVIQNDLLFLLCQTFCIRLYVLKITSSQCRAARGLINWSQTTLSMEAGISRATLAEFEGGKRTPISNNLTAIQSALEKAGVVFIPENGGGPGVRLKMHID